MSSYDTYLQRYQQAMAPAIDYMQRSQAASSVGLDYNSMSQSQISQLFGTNPAYGANTGNTSSIQSMVNDVTGGFNPYIQSLQVTMGMGMNQYYSASPYSAYSMGSMSPAYSMYGQQYAPQQMSQYGQLGGYPSLSAGYPQAQYYMADPAYAMSASASPETMTTSDSDIQNQILYALLGQVASGETNSTGADISVW